MDEARRDIVAGVGEIILEDFLIKAGVVIKEDVRVPMIVTTPPVPPPLSIEMVFSDAGGGFVVENKMGTRNCQFLVAMQQNRLGGYGMEPPQPPSSHMGYVNGDVVAAFTGKRVVVEEGREGQLLTSCRLTKVHSKNSDV
ncbi:putative G-box-binding factor 4-like isoform 2 [Capsicum annuum]|nr:putative G-box-binding factor 4-like isoform 2 [Capsicum annuum]KAF3632088.1 putative G-box-binding factor 4-like isoform 2 [Capsicum annuum]